VPQTIEQDGSWAWLSGHEITGEFLGEMGRTLKVFKAALGFVERCLEHRGADGRTRPDARSTGWGIEGNSEGRLDVCPET